MSRHVATTRRTRRVVWLLVLGIGVLLWSNVVLAATWFTRDTLSSVAPHGTITTIHLTPNRGNWDLITRLLGPIPLISNRGLTIQDLSPLIHGELAIYLLEDGGRAVGIRTQEEEIPLEIMDAHGVVVQEVSPHLFILSDRILSTSSAERNSDFRLFGGRIGWNRIGTIWFVDEYRVGAGLFAKKDRLSLTLPRTHLSKLPWKQLPSDTVAALATPALPTTDIQGVTGAIDTLLRSMETPTSEDIMSKISQNSGNILLTSDKDGLGYLVSNPTEILDLETLKQIIRTHVSMKHPSVTPLELPDQTQAQELVVDPSFINMEEVTMLGTPILRVKSGENDVIYAAQTENASALSNRESLLQFWLHPETNTATISCPGAHAFLDLERMSEVSSTDIHAYLPTLYATFSKSYSHILVTPGFFKTHVMFCDECCG